MKPETKFKLKVYKRLDVIPHLEYDKIQQVSLRGVPDIIGCYMGLYFAFELKVGKNKTDALQAYKLNKTQGSGGFARVVHPENLDEVIKDLTAWPRLYSEKKIALKKLINLPESKS